MCFSLTLPMRYGEKRRAPTICPIGAIGESGQQKGSTYFCQLVIKPKLICLFSCFL